MRNSAGPLAPTGYSRCTGRRLSFPVRYLAGPAGRPLTDRRGRKEGAGRGREENREVKCSASHVAAIAPS